MTAVKKKERLEINRWLARYYALLSEWFIGIYPDSRSLSIGPSNHAELGKKVLEARDTLLSLKGMDAKTSNMIALDYERVSKTLPELEALLDVDNPDYIKNVHPQNLVDFEHEREYLTKQTLERNKIFSKE